MSAPERFQVGDTVRCVRGYRKLKEGNRYTISWVGSGYTVMVGSGYTVMVGELEGQAWDSDRFVLGSRPTPPALDPFAWNSEVLWTASGPLAGCVNSTIAAWVAWSRFCCWAAQSNLAAHFLPTVAAARTRASNGRDVPPATVLVELPVDVVEWWARPTYHFYVDRNQRMAAACRRAMGGGA